MHFGAFVGDENNVFEFFAAKYRVAVGFELSSNFVRSVYIAQGGLVYIELGVVYPV